MVKGILISTWKLLLKKQVESVVSDNLFAGEAVYLSYVLVYFMELCQHSCVICTKSCCPLA